MDLAFSFNALVHLYFFGLEAFLLNVTLRNLCSHPLAIENILPRKVSHFPP